MKAIELEVSIVDKIIPYTIVDGSSGLNIMLISTIEKLGLSITGPSFYIINMANQSQDTLLE